MICERCGSFIDDDALTCDHCGAFVGSFDHTARDTGVRAIRQGRASSSAPTLPPRRGDMREYGDYDLSKVPLENERAPRRKPASPMKEAAVNAASRPAAKRGVPVQGGARTAGVPRKHARLHPVKGHGFTGMLLWLIVAVIGIVAGMGYFIYMNQSDSGQRATARKQVLAANDTALALAQSKDATLLLEREELLKEWNSVPALCYWAVAGEYVDVGDLDTAITAFQMANILDPENYDGLLETASTYELMGDEETAERIYLSLANEVSPFRSEAYTALIRLYQNNDRGPEAAETMKLAYENTDRETFRLQRREYIPQSPQVNMIAGRYEISAMKEDILLSSPQGFDVYYTMDSEAVLPEDGILSDGGAIQITEGSVALRAVCVNGKLVSDPLSVSYTFYYPSPPAPKCNLAPNTYNSAKTVSLRAGTREEYTKKQQAEMEKELTFYYTIDGSIPTEESPVYDGTPIQLPSGRVTLKAMCVNQYGKMSSTLEVGYKFNIKPPLQEMYAETDTFEGFALNKTSQEDFVKTFGKPKSEQPTAYLFMEAEARHLEYSWGYAVFALENNRWSLVRVDMNSAPSAAPRGVGFGSTEAEVCAAYKDFGQIQSPNGTRGLYYLYPTVGQVLIAENGERYIQYSCSTLESKIWVLQYWLKNGRVNRIVNYYQP